MTAHINASGIYAIKNTVTGATYIGSSRRINVRWNGHRHLLRRGKHHAKHMQCSWNTHGEAAFEFVVLELCAVADLPIREQFWLDTERPVYNGCTTAKSCALDPAVKVKIGLRSRERGKRFLVRGELLSASEIRVKYGVIRTALHARLQRGWSVDRAATEPPEGKHSRTGARIHEYRGELYTLAELVPFASCSKTALFRRIRSGLTPSEAVEMTPEQAEARRVSLIHAARSKR